MLWLCVALTAISAAIGQHATGPHRYIPRRYDPHHPPYHHPDDGRWNYRDESPKPYSFSYSAPAEIGIGQSSRQESADGTGRVQGSYTLTNDEGQSRFVQYVADHTGFRASIQTNEAGTSNQNPADVVMESLAPGARHHPAAYRPPVIYRPRAPIETPVEAAKNEIENPMEPPERPRYPLGIHPSRYHSRHYVS